MLFKQDQSWLLFSDPIETFYTSDINEVESLLKQVEVLASTSLAYAVGWISYEAAPAFDKAFTTNPASDFPLLCFGVFRNMEEFEHLGSINEVFELSSNKSIDWFLNLSQEEYTKAFDVIMENIVAGNTYQVNYTMKMIANLNKCYPDHFNRNNISESIIASQFMWQLFQHYVEKFPTPYSAFIGIDHWNLLSFSPELFWELDGDKISTRPMKGTIARGKTKNKDRENYHKLLSSAKDRAENLMIVDMIRNDLGKIAVAGSVCTKSLFDIEKYDSVWQMTSTIEAKTKAGLFDIMKALFPCASITGAPKVSAMKIISEIESEARDIYTGAMGWYHPSERKGCFNVCIRTILANRDSGILKYGVGGGIVYDSTAESEFDEAKLKADFLSDSICEGFRNDN